MAQNIYDQPDFFEGYSGLARSVKGLDGAPEWPAIRAMLPALDGRRIVDLGCGFGWFARWARAHGAASVLGLDLSENMLARARSETTDPAVHYAIADLENLELPPAAFDLAYSSLAFHYVADFDRLVRTIYRALVPGAHFVFTIEHPIYMASTRPGWLATEDGRRTWPVDHYAIEGERRTDWLTQRVVKYHRTLGTTLSSLIGAEFAIHHVEEWSPTAEQVAVQPELKEELERPMMALIEVLRPRSTEMFRDLAG
jgi:SAM-dependent methyltransferase